LWSDSLQDDIRRNLADHNAGGQQLRSDIDLVCGDIQVFGYGRCKRGTDVPSVYLEGEEGEAKNGDEDCVESARVSTHKAFEKAHLT
jgi:hypothetical protein